MRPSKRTTPSHLKVVKRKLRKIKKDSQKNELEEQYRVVTICNRCTHFLNKEPDTVRKDLWYNHFCKASPLKKKKDFYDGKVKSVKINSVGVGVFTDDNYAHCSDINNGNCELWEPDYIKKTINNEVDHE